MAQLSNELFQLLNGEKLAGKRHEAMMLPLVISHEDLDWAIEKITRVLSK